jgi:hypothetical protein
MESSVPQILCFVFAIVVGYFAGRMNQIFTQRR